MVKKRIDKYMYQWIICSEQKIYLIASGFKKINEKNIFLPLRPLKFRSGQYPADFTTYRAISHREI